MSYSNRSTSSSKAQLPKNHDKLRQHKGTATWCKKVRGRVYYLGKISADPDGSRAKQEWHRIKDAAYAGEELPDRARACAVTVKTLVNSFLTHKQTRVDSGELGQRTWMSYHATGNNLVNRARLGDRAAEDLTQADFARLRQLLTETLGSMALATEMSRVRSIFLYGLKKKLIKVPADFGVEFDPPKKDVILRQQKAHRQEHGKRMFEAKELLQIIDAAKLPLKAQTLLAINGGLGQTDLALLPRKLTEEAIESGWLDYARHKTVIDRRIPLWPQTIAVLKEWLTERNKLKAKDPVDAKLLFLTPAGAPYVRVTAKSNRDETGIEFAKVLRSLGIKRKHVSFYALRHTFETIGGETIDQVAVDCLMGHAIQGMKSHYIKRIGDDRLRAVTEHVRRWLFGTTDDAGGDTAKSQRGKDAVEVPNEPEPEPVAPLRLFQAG